MSPCRQDAFTNDITAVPQGTGSGFLWDNEGHVITNLHVVDSAQDVLVTLQGGVEFKVKLVGADPDKDVAVLQLVDFDGQRQVRRISTIIREAGRQGARGIQRDASGLARGKGWGEREGIEGAVMERERDLHAKLEGGTGTARRVRTWRTHQLT